MVILSGSGGRVQLFYQMISDLFVQMPTYIMYM